MSNWQIFFAGKEVVELRNEPMPSPGGGELLIESSLTLISTGTELSVLSGKAPADSVWNRMFSYPYAAGYTNLGTVLACGPGIDPAWKGRRVVSHGPHAQYVISTLADLRPVPDAIPDEQAIFFNLAEIGMHGVRKGGLRWGDAVAIYGAGIIGQLCAQFCLMAGAVRRHNDDRLVDIVYELTGNPELIPAEFAVLRDEGALVMVSSPLGPTWFDFHDLCNRTSVRIIGAHNFSHPKVESPQTPWTNKRDCAFFFDMLETGDLDLSHMVSHRFSYEEAPQVYHRLLEDRGSHMGVLFRWR